MIRKWFKRNRTQILFVFALLVPLVTGWTLYGLFGHQLIQAMYEGKSIAVLNSIIKGQATRPLENYIQRADILFFKMNFFCILVYFISSFFVSFRYKRCSLTVIVSLAILLTGSTVHILAGYSHTDLSGHAYGSDDAYISYRYAKSFAEGRGLVYNSGERVEGYSNFLYVLLMSLGHLILGGKSVYSVSITLNILFIAMAFFVFYKYIQRQLGDTMAVTGIFLLACCPSVWIWVGAGTETVLVLLIQIGIWIKVQKIADDQKSNDLIILNILIVLSVLARADGFILPIIAIVYLLLKRRIRAALYVSTALVAVVTTYFTWRYSYYGYFLPNTYYVKVSGPLMARLEYAIRQLYEIALEQGLLVYLLVLLGGMFLVLRNLIRNGEQNLLDIRFNTLFGNVWLIYWIYIGGDHFKERFLIIMFPLGIFGLLKLFEGSLNKRTLIFIVFLVLLFQLECLLSDRRFDYSFPKYDRRIVLGKFLGEKYPGKTLATGAAGKIPYFSGLRTIDMLGLNDEYIGHKETDYFFEPGHNKHDLEYVLLKKPDIMHIWIMPNMYPDLIKEKYGKNYRLRYLVNKNKESCSHDIIDVENLSRKEIVKLIEKGYGHAVLEKGQ